MQKDCREQSLPCRLPKARFAHEKSFHTIFSNLRPADYESGGLVDLCSVSERVVRCILMQVATALETRAYPETRYTCPTENAHVFMASLSQRVSGDNKCRLTEPDSNPNRFRKRSQKIGTAHNFPVWSRGVSVSCRPAADNCF